MPRNKPGLPKDYAKMGFAKGWKAYKASLKKKGSPSKSKSTSSPTKNRGGSSNMKVSIGIASTIASILGALKTAVGMLGAYPVEQALQGNFPGAAKAIANKVKTGFPINPKMIIEGIVLAGGSQMARVTLNKMRWNPAIVQVGGLTIRVV